MPYSTYARERLGSATIRPGEPVEAGSYASFELCYTAGFFGIDDSGSLRIAQRFASDMEPPQFEDPAASGYVSVEASNGATLSCHYDIKGNIRPWDRTIRIKVVRGYLKEGDSIQVRFGDRRQGSPGIRMQTFCEDRFELKVLVDAFATSDSVELPESPSLRVVAGPPVRWRVVLPTRRSVGQAFRCCVKAEDLWGNPADWSDTAVHLRAVGVAVDLPRLVRTSCEPVAQIQGLVAEHEGDLVVEACDPQGTLLARSNPSRVTARQDRGACWPYWADMHGQSEETIGTNPVRDYFRFGRDRAFLDVMCHQGNDFQITREFWKDLQRAVEEFNSPGRLVVFPGYEWSGNTELGGDHNVIFLRPGEQIRRSSHALVPDLEDAGTDCHTSRELYAALSGTEAFLYAHVGGRYATLAAARGSAFSPAVEVHSAWGTFEWLLHDAFRLGLRPGVVANSDDHKGRPGASYPGASRFGAYGGLTCFLATELTREAIFDSLRHRRHYATTGARLHLHVEATTTEGGRAIMGGELSTARREIRLRVEALCAAAVERVEIWNGGHRVQTARPYGEKDLGRRVRLLWEGAEYRGRGRETVWDGEPRIEGNAATRVEQINFWNPERKLAVDGPAALSWRSLTTGGFCGIELRLSDPSAGFLRLRTPLVQHDIALVEIGLDDTVLEAGGLGRKVRLYRLPDAPGDPGMTFDGPVALQEGVDNPVYVRLVLGDRHVAWSSPIYVTVQPERS